MAGQIGKTICASSLAATRRRRKLPHLTGGDYDRDDAFAAALGTAITPRLNPGDALIFGQSQLSTYVAVFSTDLWRHGRIS